MKSERTAGPWHARLGYVYSHSAGVCMCYGQNQADATMIAAAPEMLDALVAVAAVLDADYLSHQDRHEAIAEIFERSAYATINKANGLRD